VQSLISTASHPSKPRIISLLFTTYDIRFKIHSTPSFQCPRLLLLGAIRHRQSRFMSFQARLPGACRGGRNIPKLCDSETVLRTNTMTLHTSLLSTKFFRILNSAWVTLFTCQKLMSLSVREAGSTRRRQVSKGLSVDLNQVVLPPDSVTYPLTQYLPPITHPSPGSCICIMYIVSFLS